MSDRSVAIDIQNFNISFGDKKVVKDLSFKIYKGEVFGFLGSNGSGKTTTLRALLNLYKADSGKLLIHGQPYVVGKSVVIGYLPEERGLYKQESVLATMVYFGQLKGMTAAAARDFTHAFLKRVDLSDKINTRIDKLSGGQQQKIQLGITIMNNPEILILDEPTKGFDPVNRHLLIDIIKEQQDLGATIVYVTHYMEEVDDLCDRAILLKDGQSAAYGEIGKIKQDFHCKTMDEVFIKIYGNKIAGEK